MGSKLEEYINKAFEDMKKLTFSEPWSSHVDPRKFRVTSDPRPVAGGVEYEVEPDERIQEKVNKNQIFPKVKVSFDHPMKGTREKYPEQRVLISTFVRVSDDEGNIYLPKFSEQFTLYACSELTARNSMMSEAMSRFMMNVYQVILFGDEKLKLYDAKGRPFYPRDEDQSSERWRIKDVMQAEQRVRDMGKIEL